MGDAEEQAEPMFYPDDVPELILSVEASDLRFAGPDDRLDEDRVTLRGKVGEHRGQILDSDLESGLVPSLNPAPTNLGELEMPTGEDVDTPALLKVLFPSLDPSQELESRCGHSRSIPQYVLSETSLVVLRSASAHRGRALRGVRRRGAC